MKSPNKLPVYYSLCHYMFYIFSYLIYCLVFSPGFKAYYMGQNSTIKQHIARVPSIVAMGSVVHINMMRMRKNIFKYTYTGILLNGARA